MNKYDKELLHFADMEIEIIEQGEISVATLTSYKTFIVSESEFEVSEDVLKYVLQEPLNIIMNTRDEVKIIATIANINQVIPNFVDIGTDVLSILISGALLSFDDLQEGLNMLDGVNSTNVYINVAIKRLLLLVALGNKDIIKIKAYSKQLRAAWEVNALVVDKIAWTVRDFNV